MKTRIATVDGYPINIPFKTSIDHNLKKRRRSESIVVEIRTTCGFVGYGEGAPRKYVTGETMTTLIEQGSNLLAQLQGVAFERLADIRAIVRSFTGSFPALAAAVEIALLDIWGQMNRCSLGKVFQSNKVFTPVYSAVVPFLSLQKLNKWLDLVEAVGFQQLKLKVGHDNDEAYLALIRKRLGSEVEIRLDANRAWSFEEAIQKIKALEQYTISSLEEPLTKEALERLPDLSDRINTPILLDESVCNMEQAVYYAQQIAASKLRFNLKISKMGGLLNTAAIHAFATQHGILCQLGCNVGETAILSAAGRLFAQHHSLIALEGAYAPFFMEDDIGETAISFGVQGIGKPLTSNGLGIKINRQKLKKYSGSINAFHVIENRLSAQY
jgi:muconate cycloisomerase